ncbi:glycosyltransferase [Bacillus halotolerans]|nr:glycosyltransferase [Bacillus halotolerans]
MMADNHKFLYSIVIAVYNVGNYLEETINSILEQSIGFKDNIQLILVNDGSTDNSGEVCLKYAKKYPENIFYKQQKNGGVSKARNLGLTNVEGKYVNFLDGDDLLDKDALKYITEFFEKNKENIDLVAIPLKLFGKVNWDHPLQYKFYKTRIVDINKEYNAIQLSSSSAFIKVEAIKGRKFDETLKYAEDAKLLTQIILDKQKYGIVKEAIYHYRKRDDESSATQRGLKIKIGTSIT